MFLISFTFLYWDSYYFVNETFNGFIIWLTILLRIISVSFLSAVQLEHLAWIFFGFSVHLFSYITFQLSVHTYYRDLLVLIFNSLILINIIVSIELEMRSWYQNICVSLSLGITPIRGVTYRGGSVFERPIIGER